MFGENHEKHHKADQTLVARLHQHVGQLKVERDSLAEKSGQLAVVVDLEHRVLSTVRQRALLDISRSSLYYRRKGTSPEDLSLMGA